MILSTIHWLSALLLISFCWAEDNSDDCKCVLFYLCRGGIITDDGYYVINARSLYPYSERLQSEGDSDPSDNNDDGSRTCSSYLEICCRPPKQRTDVDSVVPTNNSSVEPKTDEQRKHGNFSFPSIKYNKTETGVFPWSVVILEQEEEASGDVLVCGGSIIHPQLVLTAAHCIVFEDPSKLKVRAGDWIVKEKSRQDRRVQKAILHEDFDRHTLFNDFALLVLREPLVLDNSSVNVVRLPEAGDNFDHSRCIASGWGKSRKDKKDYMANFKRIELPVVPRGQCQNSLRTVGTLGEYFRLHSSFVCAGGESKDKDTNDSDGGFSLVCPSTKDQPQPLLLAGIVAWGEAEWYEHKIPNVYANVAAARSWIDRQAKQAGFDLDKYHRR